MRLGVNFESDTEKGMKRLATHGTTRLERLPPELQPDTHPKKQ